MRRKILISVSCALVIVIVIIILCAPHEKLQRCSLEMPYDMLNWPECKNLCTSEVELTLIDVDFEQDSGHGHQVLLLARQNPLLRDIKDKVNIHTIEPETQDAEGLAKAIKTAADTCGGVLCISLGTYTDNEELRSAVEYASEKGCLILAAAGNDAAEFPIFPAAYESCIAVTSVDNEKHGMLLNNRGDWIDVSIPGENLEIVNGQKTEMLTGTSASTVLMACITAALKSMETGLTDRELRLLLQDSCIDLGEKGKDPVYGYGLLDCSKLIEICADSV